MAEVWFDGTPIKQVTIEADSSNTVTYVLETDGMLLPNGGTLESADESNGGKAYGTVSGSGTDEFWLIGGDVTNVSTFRGDVVASVDGSTV